MQLEALHAADGAKIGNANEITKQIERIKGNLKIITIGCRTYAMNKIIFVIVVRSTYISAAFSIFNHYLFRFLSFFFFKVYLIAGNLSRLPVI